jgi:hypothetical protein
LRISRRKRAAYKSAKMPTISREAVVLHARVGRVAHSGVGALQHQDAVYG